MKEKIKLLLEDVLPLVDLDSDFLFAELDSLGIPYQNDAGKYQGYLFSSRGFNYVKGSFKKTDFLIDSKCIFTNKSVKTGAYSQILHNILHSFIFQFNIVSKTRRI